MNSFFIGPAEKQILATLTAPRRIENAETVVVLCYPFGQEYMRAHRAYRQLASLLNRAGLFVLRFDYPGSGDSYGDESLRDMPLLMQDLRRVVDAALERSACRQVYVAGLRFGAMVAAAMAAQFEEVKGLFLWDAFASGEHFLADCSSQLADPNQQQDQTWWIHGYPLAETFRKDIAGLDLCRLAFSDELHMEHVVSHENDSTKQLLDGFGGRLNQQLVPSNGDWNYVDMEGSILMPSELVRVLSKTIASAANGAVA